MSVKIGTRQVGDITVIDVSGRITLGDRDRLAGVGVEHPVISLVARVRPARDDVVAQAESGDVLPGARGR